MSGIEVAGLVLGAVPLIIAALEAYNEGLDPIKSFVRWERELPQFIRKLRNQHVHYAQTIRILLETITTEFELAEMLSEPSGQLWKDKDMLLKLEDKLQESYQAYRSTIADIERITKRIADKLDLERAVELTRNDLEAIIVANPPKANDKFEFRKRVRFGMNKKTIKALLEELDDCNKQLERFTDKSEKIETFRKVTKPSFATRLQRIQSYARNLHESLLLSWSCSCRSYHKTSLQLEPRGNIYATKTKKAGQSAQTCFRVSFTSSGDSTHPWHLQIAEIHIKEEDDQKCSTPLKPEKKPRMAKSVSFGNTPPPPYSVLQNPAAALPPVLQEVKDMCASIQQLHKSSPCIGFSLDSRSKLRGVYPITPTIESKVASCELVTLEELLDSPPEVNGKPAKLSKKERYALALTLASSALQLNGTPWFPDRWGAKDILFHRTLSGHRLIDIDHPYVTSKLDELSKVASNVQKPRGFHNKNTILLALAVALLELYFGVSAEKHQKSEDGTANDAQLTNPWTLLALAYEWTESEQENMSAAFSNAVSHCLQCFSNPSASLQDNDFLQAAVEGIVLPLQDELCQFLGTQVP
ncbi:hypothetical protein BDV95DRAFT_631755 [Massariosphaeria phaeospora]|uniref:DUF7580 domain-containing protein n=1 Tax=Massariosphaeria phaeospora TaxID=100035 RepID=A0A7C8HZT2_9PLEO|nr:hypothetical protein BDV95DRAFT_631755 [Massariosphaeria phaeospora]